LKLTATLLALTLAVSASAQTPAAPATKTAAPAAKSATTAKPATAAVHATPNGPSNIPIVHGIKKPLYSLTYIDTLIGSGPLAESSTLGKSQADSKIMWYTVHYTGWLAKDGTKFDSSVDRGSPITFPYGIGKVIPGWDTGFEGMHIGGKRRIFIPYQLAYGPNGRPPVIPAKANLIFDVELIGVSDKPPAPPTPPAAQKSPTTPAAPGAPKAPAAPTAPAAAPAAAPATPAAPAATPAPAAKPATK
jgi:peptidylprolyl isomerase